jgi:hypothetical protein
VQHIVNVTPDDSEETFRVAVYTAPKTNANKDKPIRVIAYYSKSVASFQMSLFLHSEGRRLDNSTVWLIRFTDCNNDEQKAHILEREYWRPKGTIIGEDDSEFSEIERL